MNHWTEKEVQDFIRFIQSKGGKVEEYSSYADGTYQFSIKPPVNANTPTWAFDRMKEFDTKR